MEFIRYTNPNPLTPEEKDQLLKEYVQYYEEVVKDGRLDLLNQKLPRSAVSDILDNIGSMLKSESQRLAESDGEVKDFLKANPLPCEMAEMLPDGFRVFTLLLNALKQWVMAESAYCDRYLMGGTVRKNCRKAIDHCLVTGEPLDEKLELHHPVRDGRPPIPLSKRGHSIIEGQVSSDKTGEVGEVENNTDNDSDWELLKNFRKQKNRSWVMLREGIMAIKTGSMSCRPVSKAFANSVIRELGMQPDYILEVLDEHNV